MATLSTSAPRNNKLRLKLLEDKSSEVLLDLDALSGLTEISLEVEERSGFKYIAKLGVSLGPFTSKVNVSSQLISIIPRYVVFNESEEAIVVRQCYSEVCIHTEDAIYLDVS